MTRIYNTPTVRATYAALKAATDDGYDDAWAAHREALDAAEDAYIAGTLSTTD